MRCSYVLVMELCEKDMLTHLCNLGTCSEGQGRTYCRQLISAFEYLHQRNIVHRDLKAENMMLDKSNNIKIIDFVRYTVSMCTTAPNVPLLSGLATSLHPFFPRPLDLFLMGDCRPLFWIQLFRVSATI